MMSFRFMVYLRARDGESAAGGGRRAIGALDRSCLSVDWLVKVPMTGHGGVNGAGGAPIVVVAAGEDRVRGTNSETKGAASGGIGLSPGLVISVDPSGMPARPTCKVDGAGIDVAAPVLPVCAQPVGAVPAMPRRTDTRARHLGRIEWDAGGRDGLAGT
jgi:hypothetical protein